MQCACAVFIVTCGLTGCEISPHIVHKSSKNVWHLSNKVSNIIRRLMDDMKLLLICTLRVLLSQYFFINVYMVLFLFNNVIYVFLLLWLCILTVCLCMTTLTEVFSCIFLSCKANARVKPAKTGHGPHSS